MTCTMRHFIGMLETLQVASAARSFPQVMMFCYLGLCSLTDWPKCAFSRCLQTSPVFFLGGDVCTQLYSTAFQPSQYSLQCTPVSLQLMRYQLSGA